jgi:hypothetical protein
VRSDPAPSTRSYSTSAGGWRTQKSHPSMVSRIANLTAAFGIAAAQANRLTGTLWCSTIAHTAAEITLIAALTTTP